MTVCLHVRVWCESEVGSRMNITNLYIIVGVRVCVEKLSDLDDALHEVLLGYGIATLYHLLQHSWQNILQTYKSVLYSSETGTHTTVHTHTHTHTCTNTVNTLNNTSALANMPHHVSLSTVYTHTKVYRARPFGRGQSQWTQAERDERGWFRPGSSAPASLSLSSPSPWCGPGAASSPTACSSLQNSAG